MPTITKNRKKIDNLFPKNREKLSIEKAVSNVVRCSFAKFDESVDTAINLNFGAKKTGQTIKGVVSLPNGNGKKQKILAICCNGDEEKCLNAGANYAGGIKYVEDFIGKNSLSNFVVVADFNMMLEIGSSGLAKILGPKKLMPNLANGTVSRDITKTIENITKGQVKYCCDKNGIVHCSVGRVSFGEEKLVENIKFFISNIEKSRPQNVKGSGFIKKVSISSTMGPSFRIY